MASVDVSVTSELSPHRAWSQASDLQRFGEWLTIFGGWKSDVPPQIEVGTQVASLIKVKGFRNVIDWRVTGYDEPKRIELAGSGRGGVQIDLTLTVEPSGPRGSSFRVAAELSGGLLSTPIGSLIAKVLKSDVARSVRNLADMQ